MMPNRLATTTATGVRRADNNRARTSGASHSVALRVGAFPNHIDVPSSITAGPPTDCSWLVGGGRPRLAWGPGSAAHPAHFVVLDALSERSLRPYACIVYDNRARLDELFDGTANILGMRGHQNQRVAVGDIVGELHAGHAAQVVDFIVAVVRVVETEARRA